MVRENDLGVTQSPARTPGNGRPDKSRPLRQRLSPYKSAPKSEYLRTKRSPILKPTSSAAGTFELVKVKLLFNTYLDSLRCEMKLEELQRFFHHLNL